MFFQSSSPGAAGGDANTRGGGSVAPLAHLAHLIFAFRAVSAHRARMAATTARSALATRRIPFECAVSRRRRTCPSPDCSKSALPLFHSFAHYALEIEFSAILVRLKQRVARGLIVGRMTRRAREGELGLLSTSALLHALRCPLRLHTRRASPSSATPAVARSFELHSFYACARSRSPTITLLARGEIYGVANADASVGAVGFASC